MRLLNLTLNNNNPSSEEIFIQEGESILTLYSDLNSDELLLLTKANTSGQIDLSSIHSEDMNTFKPIYKGINYIKIQSLISREVKIKVFIN
jgi:hypothetical protein